MHTLLRIIFSFNTISITVTYNNQLRGRVDLLSKRQNILYSRMTSPVFKFQNILLKCSVNIIIIVTGCNFFLTQIKLRILRL